MRTLECVLFALVVAWSGTSAAQEPPPGDTLQWDPRWEQAEPWQYVTVPVVLVAAFEARLFGPVPEPNLGVGPFDRRLQRALSVHDEDFRWRMEIAGDVGFFGIMGFRLLDDVLAGALHDDSWNITRELMMIDLTSFALAGGLLWTMQMLVARERPARFFCRRDADYRRSRPTCDRNVPPRSLYAGHTTIAVTGAALTCLHHARLPLYGGRAGDAAACGTAIAFATMTAISRSLIDAHWPSDQLIGITVGLVSGLLVPIALHYGFGTGRGYIGRAP